MKNNYIKNLEILTFEKHNIEVMVKIDYRQKVISLVDERYQPKKWVFADRGLEYMGGWKNILEAIEYTVKEASKLLQEVVDQETEQNVKLVHKLDKAFGWWKGDEKAI